MDRGRNPSILSGQVAPPTINNLLPQKQAVDDRPQEPGEEAQDQDRSQRQAFPEAEEGDQVETDAGENPPERPPGVAGHERAVAGVFGIEPEEDDQPRQRHGGDESGHRR